MLIHSHIVKGIFNSRYFVRVDDKELLKLPMQSMLYITNKTRNSMKCFKKR